MTPTGGPLCLPGSKMSSTGSKPVTRAPTFGAAQLGTSDRGVHRGDHAGTCLQPRDYPRPRLIQSRPPRPVPVSLEELLSSMGRSDINAEQVCVDTFLSQRVATFFARMEPVKFRVEVSGWVRPFGVDRELERDGAEAPSLSCPIARVYGNAAVGLGKLDRAVRCVECRLPNDDAHVAAGLGDDVGAEVTGRAHPLSPITVPEDACRDLSGLAGL
jgi:hypothetical protein